MSKYRKLKKGEHKDIASINIQFENCETATVSREDIGNFFASGIKKDISMCANAVVELNVADQIFLAVPKEKAEKIVCGFGMPKYDTDLITRTTKFSDITNFYIKYNTGEEERITAPWVGDNDYHNLAQNVRVENDENSKRNQEYLIIDIERLLPMGPQGPVGPKGDKGEPGTSK